MSPGRPPFPDRTADTYLANTGRAGAIIRGLLRSGKASPRRLAETSDQGAEFIRLERRAAHGASYWVARDGTEIRAGINFADAETLQPGFVEAMERTGVTRQKS
jgi:hypothetical protein